MPEEKYSLGKVRPELIKRIARELLSMYPDKFTKDFEYNKRVVETLTTVSSVKVRNRIAGYITGLMNRGQSPERIKRY